MKILFILKTQFHFLVLCQPIKMTTIFQYLTTIIQPAIVKITEIIILDNTAVLKPVHLSLIICHQLARSHVSSFFLGPSLLLCFVKSSLLDKKVINALCYREVCLVMPYKLTSFFFSHFRLLQNIFGVVQASAQVKVFYKVNILGQLLF